MTGTSFFILIGQPFGFDGSRRISSSASCICGPNYAGTNGAVVVRAGGGTLIDMINANIHGTTDDPAPVFLTGRYHDRCICLQKNGRICARHEIAGGKVTQGILLPQ